MNRKKKNAAQQRQTSRELIDIQKITEYGLLTSHGELVFFSMERNLISTCQVCDCTRCARQNNCPNEEAACGECTPTNPAWHCADYLPMVERSQKC